MFIQPDFDCPSKSPRPANDIVPMLPSVIDAVKSTRAEVESAVLVAALATGSKANVSPPQPTRAVGGALFAQPGCGFLECRDRPGHHVLALEELHPVVERAFTENCGHIDSERLLVLVVVAFDEVRTTDQRAESPPELRLERSDREEAAVGCLVDPVAGEPAGQRALPLAEQPVRGKSMCVVRHGDGETCAMPCSLAFDQCAENLDDCVEGTAC